MTAPVALQGPRHRYLIGDGLTRHDPDCPRCTPPRVVRVIHGPDVDVVTCPRCRRINVVTVRSCACGIGARA